MNGNVLPLPTPEPEEGGIFEIKLPPPLPRIPPGRYQARSVEFKRFVAFNRENLRLDFDVFDGDATRGIVLAQIPMFMRWPGKKVLSPNTRLARLFYLAGIRPQRQSKLSLSPLQHKLWRVVVNDAGKDSEDQELPEPVRYSVITQVLERLA